MRLALPSVMTPTPPSTRVAMTSGLAMESSALFVGEGVLPAAHQKAYRRSSEFESLAQPVGEIADIVLRQRLQLVAEQGKGRWPGFHLRHVPHLDPASADRGRRMPLQRLLQEPVQLRR